MSRPRAHMGLVASVVLVATVLAQERPNLSGRWVAVGANSQPQPPLVVSQSPTSLTVQNWSTVGPSSGTYSWGTNPQQPVETSNATWVGMKLVATLPTNGASGAARTESWSLDRVGKLTVLIEIR